MKKIFVFSFAALLFAACSGNAEHVVAGEENEVATANEDATAYEVNTEKSVVEWFGSKHLGKTHHGTIQLTNGSLSVENGEITAGEFTADMMTIKNVDLPVDGEYNQAMLEGHLKSDDFFDVAKYPTATFHITSIKQEAGENGNTHIVSGNFTLKDVTKEISFPAKVTVADDNASLTADFHFNRLDWGVNYDKDGVEGLLDKLTKQGKDDFVKNEIGLKISLVAKN